MAKRDISRVGTTASLFLLVLATWPITTLAEPGQAQVAFKTALDRLSSSRMMAHVERLSSPDFAGRQTGTQGDSQSGLYVKEIFSSLSLQTDNPKARHETIQSRSRTNRVPTIHIGEDSQLELFLNEKPFALTVGTQYLPILDSPSVQVTAPIVFVGYGISDPARGFDEYEGVDVQNRIALFLRGKPQGYPQRVSHATKEQIAREKGAVAYLTATGPVRSPYEIRRGIPAGPLAYYGYPGSVDQFPLPGAWISTDIAETILASKGQSLSTIQERLNDNLTPQSCSTQVLAGMLWNSTQKFGTLNNVSGLLPGKDPDAGHDTIIVGAHRDHFGQQAGLLFPGADDNASGTAVLLEVARVLAQSEVKPKRSILFLSFSGEEQGLLGSRLYVSHPTRPLHETVAMINLDHVGVGNGRLTVGVTGLKKSLASEAGNLVGLADKLDVYGYFPGGDHVPFKEAGIPTMTIVSSGPHPHFHQPSDIPETLQPDILETVARYLLALIWHLAH